MVHTSYLTLDQWSIFNYEMRAMVVRSGTSAAARISYTYFERGRDLDFLYTNVSISVSVDCSIWFSFLKTVQLICNCFATRCNGLCVIIDFRRDFPTPLAFPLRCRCFYWCFNFSKVLFWTWVDRRIAVKLNNPSFLHVSKRKHVFCWPTEFGRDRAPSRLETIVPKRWQSGSVKSFG